MIGEFLAAWVQTQAELAALVGRRVEPNASRQSDRRPRIVYHRISDSPLRHLGGRSGERRVRYQLDCYGQDSDQSRHIADLIDALDGYSGTLAGVTVRAVQTVDFRDGYDLEAGGPEARPFTSVDLFIWHNT